MNLRTRLALAFAIASVGVIATIAAVVYARGHAAARDQLALRLGHIATGMRDRLDTGMYERQQDIRIIADIEALRAFREGRDVLRSYLGRRQASHPEFSWIGFTDPSGRVLAATGGLLEGVDVSTRPWWSNALKGEFVGEVHEAALLQEALRPGLKERLRFVDIAYPVHSSGAVVGVVGAQVGWDWARQLAGRVLSAAGTTDVEIFVISGEGRVLLGPVAMEGSMLPAALGGTARKDGYGEHRWPDGRAYASSSSLTRGDRSYVGLGWQVVARQSADAAFAAVGRLRDELLVGGAVGVLLASLLGYFLAGRLAAPLERLASAADRFGAGDRKVEFPRIDSPPELGRLSSALRAMAAQVGTEEDALRARIEERTAALVEAIGELEGERERLAYALEGSRLAMWDLDIERGEITLSAEWARMLGKDANETRTSPFALLERVPEEEHALIQEATTNLLRGDARQYDIEHRVRRVDGSVIWIRSRGRITSRDAQGRALRATGTNADISMRKQGEQRLREQAFTDPVTTLPNRRLFNDRLQGTTARARRADARFAVVCLDLDGFKAVNDTLGHDAGDELLRTVGTRLVACVRASDTVARVGGDEFALILEPIGGEEDAKGVAAKVIDALAAPYTLGDGEARISASVGIAVYPQHGEEPDALARAADAAMYLAKSRGKGCYVTASRA